MKPLMLSNLIQATQEAIEEHGDLPVVVVASTFGYDSTIVARNSVSDTPRVERGSWAAPSHGKPEAFVIEGDI